MLIDLLIFKFLLNSKYFLKCLVKFVIIKTFNNSFSSNLYSIMPNTLILDLIKQLINDSTMYLKLINFNNI